MLYKIAVKKRSCNQNINEILLSLPDYEAINQKTQVVHILKNTKKPKDLKVKKYDGVTFYYTDHLTGGFGTASKNPQNIDLDLKINKVVVCLTDLSKNSQKLVEMFLGKKHINESVPEGKLYHAFMNIHTDKGVYSIEKADKPYVSITDELHKNDPNKNCIDVGRPNGTYTIRKLLDETEKRMGSKFNSYHARDNNCQHLVSQLLKTMGINSKPIHSFIVRDMKKLFDGQELKLFLGTQYLNFKKWLQKYKIIS